jgi:hypothetical protein
MPEPEPVFIATATPVHMQNERLAALVPGPGHVLRLLRQQLPARRRPAAPMPASSVGKDSIFPPLDQESTAVLPASTKANLFSILPLPSLLVPRNAGDRCRLTAPRKSPGSETTA